MLTLEYIAVFKDLGVVFDHQLKFGNHTDNFIKSNLIRWQVLLNVNQQNLLI